MKKKCSADQPGWSLSTCRRDVVTEGDISLCLRHLNGRLHSARTTFEHTANALRCDALKRTCVDLADYEVSVWVPGVTTDILEIKGRRERFRLCEKHRDQLAELLSGSAVSIVENDEIWSYEKEHYDQAKAALERLVAEKKRL